MKQYVTVFVCILFSIASFSQNDSTAYQRMVKQFSDGYDWAATQKGEESTNYFGRLIRSTQYVLRVENPSFLQTMEEFEKANSFALKDSMLKALTYSILADFRKKYIWKDLKVELVKYQKVLDLFSKAYCPCVTTKLQAEKRENIDKILSNCEALLIQDPITMNRIKSAIMELPIQERLRSGEYASMYTYEHCAAMTDYIDDMMYGVVLDNYYTYFEDISRHTDIKIVKLYEAKKLDSLKLIFPEYKKFEKEIKESISTINGPYPWSTERGGDSIEVHTFFTQGKNAKIVGQVKYTYVVHGLSITIRRYEFLKREEIKDRDTLEKAWGEVDDLPPPPMEELKPPVKQ